MGANFNRRIIFDTLILLSIFVVPWWVTFPLIVLSLFLFNFFWEAVAFGLVIDLVYSVHRFIFGDFPVSCLFFFFILLLVGFLRKTLRLKNG